MPQVTVLMTVYNGMPYLPLAIESILQQSFSDFELLIINDCSTDASREMILSYSDPRIRLVDNPENIKQTRSLNRGLELAQTELIARMDADDLSHPQRLAKQIAFLQTHPEVVAVGSNIRYIDPNGKPLGEWRRPQEDLGLRWLQFFSCPISNGAVMFRKSMIWDQLGGFNPDIIYAQEWELWSRIPPHQKLANLPEILLEVRLHPNSTSLAFASPAYAEIQQICRTAPLRILQITDTSSAWFHQLDTLRQMPPEHPTLALAALERLFTTFCNRFPAASRHPEVIQEFLHQCITILQLSDFPTLIQTLKNLNANPHLGLGGKNTLTLIRIYLKFGIQVVRILAAHAGARRLKHSLMRRFG